MIMKSSWRSSKRLRESIIYDSIIGSHPGIATYHFGADVHFPGGGPITVKALRGDASRDTETPTLHRLFLSAHGRPLWKYEHDIVLLKGLRAALAGHLFLCDQGILHRDISAGNILLASTSDHPGGEGFLTDLEFAYIKSDKVVLERHLTRTIPPVLTPSNDYTKPTTVTNKKWEYYPVHRGAAISGTVQFMAVEILYSVRKNCTFQHETRHDLESFIWVLCYCISRKLLQTVTAKEQKQELTKFFHNCFGRVDLDAIMQSRRARSPLLDLYREFGEHLTEPMVSLLEELDLLIYTQHHPRYPVHLTHTSILNQFDQAINALMRQT